MPKIFISYSRKNIDAANYIAIELRNHGAEVFIDYQSIQAGQSFPRRLAGEIKSSDAIVFLLSEYSAVSEWVISEVYYAHKNKKLVVPVALDTTELPDDLFFLSPIDRVDFENWSPDQPDVNAFPKLFTALHLSAAKTQESDDSPPPLLLPPKQALGPMVLPKTSSLINRPPKLQRFYPLTLLTIILGLIAFFIMKRPSPINLTPLQLAERGVQSNTDWQPYMQSFNIATMVLVPVGCFDMGKEEEGEKLGGRICFENPFWIDRTEVTNQQFGLEGSFGSNNYPRNNVSWFDAKIFCGAREARLPTEAEWEYAARGPDGLKYPWGNEFIGENAVYGENSNNLTAEVGSRPAGASWVGALDMSGNIWEWVSSIYQPYPYIETDGREDLNKESVLRILRGGSFTNNADSSLRADLRNWNDPLFRNLNLGFRCARDY